MRIRLTAAAAFALAIAGCSSPPEYTPVAGELVAGTAHVTINGQDAGTTDAVQCNTTEWLTTISTGNQEAGVQAMLSSKEDLTAQSVSITNLGGFTGSYVAGVGEQAEVKMTGRTYNISGTADGFATDNPSFRKAGTFAIAVSC